MINKILNNANESLKKGYYYTASTEFAEAYVLGGRKEGIEINPRLLFKQEHFKLIFNGIKKDYEKIINVISFGTRWDEDELLLVFTYYIKLKLLTEYFAVYEIDIIIDFEKIDILLNKIDKRKNKLTITIVRNLLKKNWKTVQLNKLTDFFL